MIIKTQCCIVGGGPAGMMLGYLLARAGIQTVVLEKHTDFLRDFRGDTVHPSTLGIMDDLGLLDEFLLLPHQKLTRLAGNFGKRRVNLADFSRLKTKGNFIAFMPQWDFLNFLAGKGRALAPFKLLMNTAFTDLIKEGEQVRGIRAKGPEGDVEIHADLTVGADGRDSAVREKAGLRVQDLGAPIDVLWFRVRRDAAEFDDSFAHIAAGKVLITLDRGEYWQCAYVIPKNTTAKVQAQGIDGFRRSVCQVFPTLQTHINDIKSWDDVKLLTVTINRLRQWSKPGLLCIGDAAHAMSPVGGVGINLAVQDAVATANLLTDKLRLGRPSEADLDAVRRRRLFPARFTQGLQVQAQNRILAPVLSGENSELKVPAIMLVLSRLPWLQGMVARIIGLGVRPEHVAWRPLPAAPAAGNGPFDQPPPTAPSSSSHS